MKVKLTDEQAIQVATNAINASIPMGMGFMHFQAKDYTSEEVLANLENGLSIDYFQGRMVKLRIRKDGDYFVFPDGKPHSEYQSWCFRYPTYEDLINSVNQEV